MLNPEDYYYTIGFSYPTIVSKKFGVGEEIGRDWFYPDLIILNYWAHYFSKMNYLNLFLTAEVTADVTFRIYFYYYTL